MSIDAEPTRPKAKILGPGVTVTVEDPISRTRTRLRVRARTGRNVELETIPGAGSTRVWEPGSTVSLRVPRPFGMFHYRATVVDPPDPGVCQLILDKTAPRRQQHRDYFRMPVRLGVRLILPEDESTVKILRARNLSAGGVLLFDPDRLLKTADSVGLGLPVGPGGEILRLPARVVRVDGDSARAALAFESVPDGARRTILRYLFRQHRRKSKKGNQSDGRIASIRAFHERT